MSQSEHTTITGTIVAAPDLHEVNGAHLAVFRVALHSTSPAFANGARFITCVLRGAYARTATPALGERVQATGYLARNTRLRRKATGVSFLRFEADKIKAA